MEVAGAHYERDDRSDSFRMIGDVVARVAETYGISIDQTTLNRWRDLIGLLREFDTLVDDQGISPDTALTELEHFEEFSANYPHLTPDAVGIDTHQRMVKRVGIILKHSRAIQQTQNIAEFVHHRREEVLHTAELVADCATSDTTTQPGFYTQFMPTLRSMGLAANFIDTLSDFRQDKHEQKVTIRGSPAFLVAIGGAAFRSFSRSAHVLKDAPTRRLFWDMSKMRLHNRREHGSRPYSSLRNLTPN